MRRFVEERIQLGFWVEGLHRASEVRDSMEQAAPRMRGFLLQNPMGGN